MKKTLITTILIALATTGLAKMTYVPVYSSMIAIEHSGDTVYSENKNSELVAESEDGKFRIAVVHEALSLNRIKSIKMQEAAMALSAFSSVLSTPSFFSSNRTVRYKGIVNSYAYGTLSAIYGANAENAKRLGMDIVIENTCSEELVVSDLERGLVWYIQPNWTLTIPVANPDILQLRVSDIHQRSICFVQIGGGSILKEIDVEWENEDCWVFPLYGTSENGWEEIVSYVLIDKATGIRSQISEAEFKEIKKQRKSKNNL